MDQSSPFVCLQRTSTDWTIDHRPKITQENESGPMFKNADQSDKRRDVTLEFDEGRKEGQL